MRAVVLSRPLSFAAEALARPVIEYPTAELRAAVSLSRLWQEQGRHNNARDLLAEVYGWFTEGFETADLREAKGLLEALS